MSVLEAAISSDAEHIKLEKQTEALASQDHGGREPLELIYESLEWIDRKII